MFVKPAPGKRVRDPQSRQHIPAEGMEVSATDTYWVRRLQDGDVVVVKPAAKAAPTPAPKAKE